MKKVGISMIWLGSVLVGSLLCSSLQAQFVGERVDKSSEHISRWRRIYSQEYQSLIDLFERTEIYKKDSGYIDHANRIMFSLRYEEGAAISELMDCPSEKTLLKIMGMRMGTNSVIYRNVGYIMEKKDYRDYADRLIVDAKIYMDGGIPQPPKQEEKVEEQK